MNNFASLTCPSCGGQLQITNDIERFACGYCGNEHIVRREGGIIALAPLMGELSQVRVGVDKTASELAIRRLEKEIKEIEVALEITLSEKERFLDQMKYLRDPGILLRIPLMDLMDTERPNHRVSWWKKLWTSRYSDQEIYDRFHSLSLEDFDALINICTTMPRWEPEKVATLIQRLNIMKGERILRQVLKSKREQLSDHRQIVS